MSENYMKYDRNTFEIELSNIVKSQGLVLGDYTEELGTSHFEERIYIVTTQNPRIGILIYSSIDPRDGQCREIGGDAVRINFVCKFNGKKYYKKFKKHLRIKTLFKNIEKSIAEANNMSVEKEIEKWIYAVSKN